MSQYTVDLHLTPEMHQMSVYRLCYCLQSLLLQLRKNQFFSSPKTSQQSVRKPNRPLFVFDSPCPDLSLYFTKPAFSEMFTEPTPDTFRGRIRDKRVRENDYQLKYAIFSTACSIVYTSTVHDQSANICIQVYLRILCI